MEKAFKVIMLGFVLLLIGVVLPFLMVMDLLESTLPLSFLAQACSVPPAS